jgi:MYXO-CTERM domain-containing protein
VAFNAGTYGPITSTVTIPCGVSMTGPTVPYSQTPNQKATINGSSSFQGPGFIYGGCGSSTPTAAFQYLEWNGEQPSNGGGFIELNAGTNNVVINNNWLHGVNAPDPSSGQSFQADLVYLCCSNSTVTDNVRIQYNIFGSMTESDCNSIMTDSSTAENGNGGLCNGVGMGNNFTNIYVEYNIFHFLEQGTKVYEGQGELNNVYFNYNEYNNIHRNMQETQADLGGSSPTLMYNDFNSYHTPYSAIQGFEISAANGCLSPSGANPANCVTHTDYNVLIQELSNAAEIGIEEWGGAGTTASYNLIQGYMFNGIVWSQNGQFTNNNNTFVMYFGNYQNGWVTGSGDTDCRTTPSGWWNEETGNVTSGDLPSCSGNTFSGWNSNEPNAGPAPTGLQTSVAPSISPASGTFLGSQVVTFTNPGANRDANTTAWCTTDGSVPSPGGGTAIGYYSGQTITLTATTTVKCVGMWGALNQPYPSVYTGFAAGPMGYQPSSVVSATYTLSSGGDAGGPSDAGGILDGGEAADAGTASDAGGIPDAGGGGAEGGCGCSGRPASGPFSVALLVLVSLVVKRRRQRQGRMRAG